MNVGQPYNPHRLFKGIFIPDPVALNEQLSLGARMCFGVLCRFSGARGDCFPSAVAIGSRIHLGERQVREYLVELEKYGLIRRRRRPQQASVIEFLWHQDFNDPEYFLQDSWEEPTAESRRSENRANGGKTYEPTAESRRCLKEEESHLRESLNNNPQGGNGKPKTPYAEQGKFEHFLGAQLRLANLRHEKVSDKVKAFLERLDEQAADREAFRAGLVEAIREHPGTGNTLSQDLGGYGGLAKDAPRRQSAKSTHRVATEATRETRLGWIREFEEKEAAKLVALKK